jgi:hypothetical protein
LRFKFEILRIETETRDLQSEIRIPQSAIERCPRQP